MNNYYRIIAFNKELNVEIVADSYGKFDKLWQFSSFFVCRGFEILSVMKEENLVFADYPKAAPDLDYILLRACGKGKPVITDGKVGFLG